MAIRGVNEIRLKRELKEYCEKYIDKHLKKAISGVDLPRCPHMAGASTREGSEDYRRSG